MAFVSLFDEETETYTARGAEFALELTSFLRSLASKAEQENISLCDLMTIATQSVVVVISKSLTQRQLKEVCGSIASGVLK